MNKKQRMLSMQKGFYLFVEKVIFFYVPSYLEMLQLTLAYQFLWET